MRIAVVSDIHGNLPALEAAIADIERHSPDQVWCGGDLAWAGPWPRECIAAVREAGWTTVRGNTDIWITGDPQTISDEDERIRFRAIAQAHDISGDDAEWLLSLPLGHRGPGSTLLVHATPDSPFVAPFADAQPAEFTVYSDEAAVVIYGHVHQAFTRRLYDGTIVCNTGSIGLPADHPLGSYLLIDQEGNDFSLRHRRIEFDRQAVIDKARSVGGPVEELCLKFLGTS